MKTVVGVQNRLERNCREGAFTLVELLVSITIFLIVCTLGFSGVKFYKGLASKSVCSSNLRQLAAATNMYCADHMGFFFPYVTYGSDGSRTWYFGKENSPPGTAEGDRDLDKEAGPLYEYIQAVGSIEMCPGFDYGSAVWKEKFKGASYGYGYNWWLGGRSTGRVLMNVANIKSGARTMLFGDCAQANTFQPPASASNPMLEEFYIIDQTERTVHFRHANKANILFVDGHVESFDVFPGTEVRKVEGELLGRITAKGSMEYLK
ncbi:hypothetical protein FEM03_21990 [Phragmitibacter flavus]|uniref:Type II secretion system protein n=1 Tax=Phragmitibacter flavus TaxID=2576071 RepID=A0A5R8K8F2_9BACT|nr:prepilin-type N-terminal cleavage/methylation domain-containing protein [Phragmitibacter flavus]TLD68593.1 hypothetical protein FEM03_21990 [Phragmitibacter flavus]